MRCEDVSVSACQERPLCPCFREWDREVRVNEARVRLESAAAAAVAVILVVGAGVDLLVSGAVRMVLRADPGYVSRPVRATFRGLVR